MEMKSSKTINFTLNRDWGLSTISFQYEDTSTGLKRKTDKTGPSWHTRASLRTRIHNLKLKHNFVLLYNVWD